MKPTWSFRPSDSSDAKWMAEVRAEVMRPDLDRLGRFDATRVRQRFLDAFAPEYTRVIEVDGHDAGLVAVRPDAESYWIEHFYLAPHHQGAGIGGEVLTHLLSEPGYAGRVFRLNVLQGSSARHLYERHGFELDHETPIDIYMHRTPPSHTPAPVESTEMDRKSRQ